MASLLPFLSEILPMIMPSATQVTRAKHLQPLHPTVEGPVIYREAVVDRSDKMCASGKSREPNHTVAYAPLDAPQSYYRRPGIVCNYFKQYSRPVPVLQARYAITASKVRPVASYPFRGVQLT